MKDLWRGLVSCWCYLDSGLRRDIHPDARKAFRSATSLLSDYFSSGSIAFDNEGNFYFIREVGTGENCGSIPLKSVQLFRDNGNVKTLIGFVNDRCADPLTSKVDFIQLGIGGGAIVFDEERGRLLFTLFSLGTGGPTVCFPCLGHWTAAINGLTTENEILQTYIPPIGPLSFSVPTRPEGFERADWFDTYYGPLTLPIDFTQAQPLQCGFPVGAPNPGDFLTVADTTPPLAPGQGWWFVTAVNHAGQTRYGRQNVGGVIQ
ncbi:MAG: hypothetical protein O6947_03865, partial [Acidobacteria bacterium]|nr:hypothetical protein [Acidobacteriota bacterium]